MSRTPITTHRSYAAYRMSVRRYRRGCDYGFRQAAFVVLQEPNKGNFISFPAAGVQKAIALLLGRRMPMLGTIGQREQIEPGDEHQCQRGQG